MQVRLLSGAPLFQGTSMATLHVSVKHSDCACFILETPEGDVEHDGYAPNAGIFGGDYTSFKVNNETGQINWLDSASGRGWKIC